jgi:hypothetical protein
VVSDTPYFVPLCRCIVVPLYRCIVVPILLSYFKFKVQD